MPTIIKLREPRIYVSKKETHRDPEKEGDKKSEEILNRFTTATVANRLTTQTPKGCREKYENVHDQTEENFHQCNHVIQRRVFATAGVLGAAKAAAAAHPAAATAAAATAKGVDRRSQGQSGRCGQGQERRGQLRGHRHGFRRLQQSDMQHRTRHYPLRPGSPLFPSAKLATTFFERQ